MSGWLVGLDIGSTTVKAVAARREGGPVAWRDYRRHETQQAETVIGFLRRLERELGATPENTALLMTGSGAAALATGLGARFVQEVNAVALAAEKFHPDAQSAIELGGQDAKMLFFEPQPGGGRRKSATMNDQCAGGTGAVIDKLSAKLRIPADKLCEQGYSGLALHPVAGKCGVFAESDINGLQKQGVPAAELMASLFEAIVLQNLSVLTRGHLLLPKVLLLGGPNTFIPGLREAWRAHIPRIWRERGVDLPAGANAEDLVVCPEDGVYYAALGAVEFGREREVAAGFAGAQALEKEMSRNRSMMSVAGLPGLRGSDAELREFKERYGAQKKSAAGFRWGERAQVFLGIDGGSTSTKAVLVDEAGVVRAKSYRLSQGNPVRDAVEIARELYDQATRACARIEICGVATTGYAKDVLSRVVHADLALVETVAHARSGVAECGDVDVIVDVGGQDIKLISLQDGHVKDFMLNTQCSAGNGYFLQATAQSFGVALQEFASRAFTATRMPEFSYGCAVFLQSDIVNFQRQGWRREEILAGLAAVLPKNIWLYVAKIPNPARLGRRFLLQGGTQRNLAAVKAQVDYLRSRFAGSGVEPDIRVHTHCGEAGAIGAALEAREHWLSGERTRFPGLASLATLRFRAWADESTRCHYCQNHCLRTFIDCAVDGRTERIMVGNCEKGSAADARHVRSLIDAGEAIKHANPDLVELAARTVWTPATPQLVAGAMPRFAFTRTQKLRKSRAGVRIGIPRVFNEYLYGGFFAAYLESLGVPRAGIVWSDFTTDAMYRAAAGRGAIDPCFPSKVASAHVHDLLGKSDAGKPLDAIFFPMFDVLETHLEHAIGTHACPSVIATPLTVQAAFGIGRDEFKSRGIAFLRPLIDFRDRTLLARQMYECWAPLLGLSQSENERALEQAFAAQRLWVAAMRARARAVLRQLQREERLGILMLGRPYHHDPGLNHGIFEEFQKRGYPVFSQSLLPVDADVLEDVFGGDHPLDIDDVWEHSYSASTTHKVWAAKFAARHPNLIAVEISNFRCGHDAPAYQLIERILESAGRPYFGFKDLDENRPAGSMRLRIETIDYYLRQHRAELVHMRIAAEEENQAAAG